MRKYLRGPVGRISFDDHYWEGTGFPTCPRERKLKYEEATREKRWESMKQCKQL